MLRKDKKIISLQYFNEVINIRHRGMSIGKGVPKNTKILCTAVSIQRHNTLYEAK